MSSPEDTAHWSSVTFEGEQTLEHVMEALRARPSSYTISQAKTGYRGNWFLWDKETDEAVLLTHAFTVAYSTPLDTGNFVPEGCTAPEGMYDSQMRREPGPRAQVNITFDYGMDPNLSEYVDFLETWVQGIPEFNKAKRARSNWMTPAYIAESSRHTVSIPVFQRKNAFNCKDGKYEVPYEVHPWIAEASVPNNQHWIPNPSIVRVLERGVDDTLVDVLLESETPALKSGDLVKMTFKVNFAVGPSSWTSNYMPVQIIRVGRVDRDLSTPAVHSEDPEVYNLPRAGEKLDDAFDEESDVEDKASNLLQRSVKAENRGTKRKIDTAIEEGSLLETEDETTSESGAPDETQLKQPLYTGKRKRYPKGKAK
ncbi:hypothetical protein DFP72DRAFT_845133 [Ephemerocybe angulata]|uniref:Uncharacterized protein n=1 Tax=Ephemerocybe angulata TaxID=980116 RepID=A0A8H6MAN1_9AGAR|nr:hypothetical protein DFP72DRAFT_845133 [Tulosesus angulatus]